MHFFPYTLLLSKYGRRKKKNIQDLNLSNHAPVVADFVVSSNWYYHA